MAYSSLKKNNMKYWWLVCIFYCLANVTNAQNTGNNPKVLAYIAQYKAIAVAEMQRTGVPAAIKLAQGIFESNNGESKLCLQSNNHFGIKCKNDWQGDRTYHDDDARGECFRVYATGADSYRDHSDFLKTRPHYAFLFQIPPTDYEAWAYGLKKAGYATNPRYPERIIQIINEYNLNEVTLSALQQTTNSTASTPLTTEPTTIGASTPPTSSDIKFVAPPANTTPTVTEEDEEEVIEEVISIALKKDTTLTVNDTSKQATPNYPQGVFTINGLKVIYAEAGISMLAIAQQHNIAYKKLIEFNELTEIDILEKSQLLFLEKKKKIGAQTIHIVVPNETMEDIAQKEGMLLQSLLDFNRIPKGRQPVSGEKIYLKGNSPTTPKLIEATTAKNTTATS
jgi:LysM repeat protein